MFRKILFLTVAGLFLSFGYVAAENSGKEKNAVAAAEKWLEMIDNGQYIKSWREASEYFKNAVDKNQWLQSMEGVRKPLGDILSRKVKSTSYHTSLPGAPDGEYVVIQFETSFENKKSAIETVTPMLEKDGTWRVAGYYIK